MPAGRMDMKLDRCAKIVAAYVSHNAVSASGLAKLIVDVHDALQSLETRQAHPKDLKPVPAVDIRKSVTDDYIVCLEDGLRFKTLKRHLSTHYGMTPDEYRAKWGLPPNYPMVAPSYANRRSHIAKQSGLGAKPRATRRLGRRQAGPAVNNPPVA